jgi:hypothetical protein
MPLVELDHAMVAVAGYAALVAYGVATRPAAKPKAAGAEAEKAADAAPRAASRGASGGKKSGGGFSAAAALAKLQKEPLMILMLLYNVAQVALCGYMMVEALRVAYANYFPRVICNAHSNNLVIVAPGAVSADAPEVCRFLSILDLDMAFDARSYVVCSY